MCFFALNSQRFFTLPYSTSHWAHNSDLPINLLIMTIPIIICQLSVSHLFWQACYVQETQTTIPFEHCSVWFHISLHFFCNQHFDFLAIRSMTGIKGKYAPLTVPLYISLICFWREVALLRPCVAHCTPPDTEYNCYIFTEINWNLCCFKINK